MGQVATPATPEVDLPTEVDPVVRQGEIRLRVKRFEMMTMVLGYRTDESRARLLRVNPKTLYRARRGNVGHDFITQTLVVLGRRRDELALFNLEPTFDELFEQVDFSAEPIGTRSVNP